MKDLSSLMIFLVLWPKYFWRLVSQCSFLGFAFPGTVGSQHGDLSVWGGGGVTGGHCPPLCRFGMMGTSQGAVFATV